jgi:hypothetical protein
MFLSLCLEKRWKMGHEHKMKIDAVLGLNTSYEQAKL